VETSIVKSAEENRAKFYRGPDGKPNFLAPYVMYIVTLNELKAILKVSAQTGHSGVVKKPHFQEVKRSKMHISNNTLQTAKKSTKPVPTSAAFKLPPKAVLTHNFFVHSQNN
jgi:hypothetical protein